MLIDRVDLDASQVKDICFDLKSKTEHLFLVLAYQQKGKAMISVALSDDLIKNKQLNAGAIVNLLAQDIGGRGGGQPFFATAGGSNVDGIELALKKANEFFLNL